MGRRGALVVPLLGEDPEDDHARAWIDALARAARAVPRRDRRARREARAAAAATPAQVRVRRASRRSFSRTASHPSRGTRRLRAAACELGDRRGVEAARPLSRGARRRRSATRRGVRRTRRMAGHHLLPLARLPPPVLFAVFDGTIGRARGQTSRRISPPNILHIRQYRLGIGWRPRARLARTAR